MSIELPSGLSAFYSEGLVSLIQGDSLTVLPQFPDGLFDLVFADPPYFLSNGGVTCRSGKMTSVNKGEWDKVPSFDEKYEFTRTWVKECKRVLTDQGTIWISGTLHNIYSVGMALEQEGFKILNNVTWQKRNPPPNLGCRCFTHSTETLLWAKKNIKKAKHVFNYEEMKEENGGKQMKDVWEGVITPRDERVEGRFPTQKPEYLLNRVIRSSSREGDLILDPFLGSGTTAAVAKRLNRRCVGIEREKEYIDIAVKRVAKG